MKLLCNILLNLTIEGHCQMPEAVPAHFFLTPYTGRRDLRANVRTVPYTAISVRFWIGSLRVGSEHINIFLAEVKAFVCSSAPSSAPESASQVRIALDCITPNVVNVVEALCNVLTRRTKSEPSTNTSNRCPHASRSNGFSAAMR